jgi:hypothetical protein
LTGVCADAVVANPKPSIVAAVVPIKRLNVMDAISTLENRRHNHLTEITPNCRDPEWFALVYKTADCVLWEFYEFLVD